jgi:hypothetical protein
MASHTDNWPSVIREAVYLLILVALVLSLPGCGTAAPCQDPGLYCDANTLCVGGIAVECATETGGTCEARTMNGPGGVTAAVPQCLPPRPPPPVLVAL